MVLPLKGLRENLPPSLCYWRNVWIAFLLCQWEQGSWAIAGIRISGASTGGLDVVKNFICMELYPLASKVLFPLIQSWKRCNWGQKQSQCPEFLFYGGAGSGVPSGQLQPISPSCVGSHGYVDKCMIAPKARSQVQASNRGQKINSFVKKINYLLTSHTCIGHAYFSQ